MCISLCPALKKGKLPMKLQTSFLDGSCVQCWPPFGNLISTGLVPAYRQCRRFIADGPMQWAGGSVVSGIVEGGSVARGSDKK